MNRYLAAFALAFALFFGLTIPAYASSETTSDSNAFNWSAVFSKVIWGTAIAIPGVIFVALNNHKEDN